MLTLWAAAPIRPSGRGEEWFCPSFAAIVIVFLVCTLVYEAVKLWAKVQVARAGQSPKSLDDD